jgi:hypothetical protein
VALGEGSHAHRQPFVQGHLQGTERRTQTGRVAVEQQQEVEGVALESTHVVPGEGRAQHRHGMAETVRMEGDGVHVPLHA